MDYAVPAENLADRLEHDAQRRQHASFAFSCGSTGNLHGAAFRKLEKVAAHQSPDGRGIVGVTLLRDVAVFGQRFNIATRGRILRDALYLVADGAQQIANSTRALVNIDVDKIPIILGNPPSVRGNYWHWTTQCLAALLHCKEQRFQVSRKLILLTTKLNGWQQRSLQLIGGDAYERVELAPDATARSEYAIYSLLLSGRSVFDPLAPRLAVADHMKAALQLRSTDPHDKAIYISRRDTHRRPMLNEEELEKALQGSGLEIVTASDMSFDDQVKLFHSAKLVVAPHGAGLANLLYCRPGTAVLELFQASYINAGMLSIARLCGLNYWADIFADDGGAQTSKGWHADIDAVLRTIDATRRSRFRRCKPPS